MEWVTKEFLRKWDSPRRREATEELHFYFTPVLIEYGKSRGLSQEAAEDVAQTTLADLFKGLKEERYDPDRGKLRGWIYGIAKNKINTHLRSLSRESVVRNNKSTWVFTSIPDEKAAKYTWNTEIRKMQLKWAYDKARKQFKPRSKMWRAFELCSTSDLSTKDIAEKLSMSPGHVLVAKHRVLSRMRELVKELDECI